MSRRQMYDDVLDVALRQTLKEHGFTRKTKRDYVQERPGRVWLFEVEMERRLGLGFMADAAVFIPDLDATLERFAPGFYGVHAPTHQTSTIWAPLRRLIELEHGRRYSVVDQPTYPEEGFDAFQRARGDHIFCYLIRGGYWTNPVYHRGPGLGLEQGQIDWDRGMNELGGFLDEIWRTLALDWYRKCDDPMFVVHWIETEGPYGVSVDCSRAVLCHMAGETDRARFYLQRRIEEGSISYDELYRQLHNEHYGNWWRQFWRRDWGDEDFVKFAKGRFGFLQKAAETARNLAAGLGIRLD